jgi:hypothetical protein
MAWMIKHTRSVFLALILLLLTHCHVNYPRLCLSCYFGHQRPNAHTLIVDISVARSLGGAWKNSRFR